MQSGNNSILLVGGKAEDKDRTLKKQVTEFHPLGSADYTVKGVVGIRQSKKLGHAIYQEGRVMLMEQVGIDLHEQEPIYSLDI